MQSRFMKAEKNPTLLILASSKRTDSSYMETFIEEKKKQNSKTTYVVDEPQWVIRTDKDSPNKFKVAIGNKYLASEVLPLTVTEAEISLYRDRGFKILDVPMGYYESFLDDIDIALTDIAGISTSNSNRYFSGPRIATVKKPGRLNLFTRDIIQVGNGKDDVTQYSDFIDLTRVTPEEKAMPLYIHMDMSVDGDKTGLAGTWITGKKPPKPNQPESNDLFFRLAFATSVKAPKGHQISFEKNRQFIYWLHENGFNIKAVTTDTYQSVDTGQALAARGFNYSVVSVDRVDSDRICKPYQYLRSTIYEERIELFENNLLIEELIGLERDNNSGKIDHSTSGINSKDQADALCGSVWRASQDAEQYAFDYGETLENIVAVSGGDNAALDHKQLQVDFEAELMKMFGASSNPNKSPVLKTSVNNQYNSNNNNQRSSAINTSQQQNSPYLDFGMGKAQPLATPYISQGIMLW